jgi:hypothetical protein
MNRFVKSDFLNLHVHFLEKSGVEGIHGLWSADGDDCDTIDNFSLKYFVLHGGSFKNPKVAKIAHILKCSGLDAIDLEFTVGPDLTRRVGKNPAGRVCFFDGINSIVIMSVVPIPMAIGTLQQDSPILNAFRIGKADIFI